MAASHFKGHPQGDTPPRTKKTHAEHMYIYIYKICPARCASPHLSCSFIPFWAQRLPRPRRGEGDYPPRRGTYLDGLLTTLTPRMHTAHMFTVSGPIEICDMDVLLRMLISIYV